MKQLAILLAFIVAGCGIADTPAPSADPSARPPFTATASPGTDEGVENPGEEEAEVSLRILDPRDGAIVRSSSVRVRGDAPPGTVVRCSIDGIAERVAVPGADGTWDLVLDSLDGPATLTCAVGDGASVEVSIDVLAPPVATPTPTPAPALVLLPKLSPKVAGASAVKYFAVTGETPEELRASIVASSRRTCDEHALACVQQSWRTTWNMRTSGSTGACRVTSARVTRTSTVYLPRWTKPSRVQPALLAWWREVLDHFAWHEGEHIRILRKHLSKLRADLVGEPCSHASAVIERWERRLREAQAAFDLEEMGWDWPKYEGADESRP